ncbi:hypothetical protein [Leptospira barantonii]|uniref:Tetratricopeptide repeat domain protein n=1 Tax=Leptospira barantonii TaxID=2023184 RepID=A0ABX4NIN3_9LEPT|nr:hypothetical protein [Leptospira barantonii]PJZ56659.1 hypothetical protein CH367_14515 [Leptospira barantonii]
MKSIHSSKRFFVLILSTFVFTNGLFADMPLPFPEELGTPLGESASADEKTKETASGNPSASIPSEKNEGSGTNPNSNSQSETKATNVSASGSAESGSTEKSGADSSVEVASSGNSEISEQESAKPATKTTLPNSEKSSLKKKKDKKKEDPSESGYKKGLLRLRENQRNNAKTEFNQSGGQGKSANASRLEDARLTAESSNDSNAITEQIDSEDEKWKAIFEVARALRGNGKIPEAETQYLKIITEAPENFQSISLLSLGEMLSSTDRKDSGRRYLLQLVKLLQKKPELDPKKDQLEKAVTMIARIYGDQGKYEEAENWAKAYLNRMNPEASEDSPFVKELRRILKRRYY